MSKKDKTILANKFLTKHTNWGALFLILCAFIFTEIIGVLCIDFPLQIITKKMVYGYGAAVFSLLALLLHKKLFFPEFSGCLTCGNKKEALKLSVIFIIYFVLSLIYPLITEGPGYFAVSHTLDHVLLFTGLSLMAGFAEETIFRGILCSYLMRQWKGQKNKIMKLFVVSSISFGLFHLINLTGGATVGYVIFQIICAVSIGSFFCALFLRSGLLWPSIIFHVVNDFIAFFLFEDEIWSKQNLFLSTQFNSENYVDILLCLVLAAVSFYLIRPSKRQEIDELWNKKWRPLSPETTGCLFRLEEEKDYRRVENMTRESFWNVYQPGCKEHYLIKCFRGKPEFVKDLDIVMEVYGKVRGHVMFVQSSVKTDDGQEIPTLTLGPICIDPQLKRKGYGLLMLNYACNKAKELGYGAIMLEGNPDFYGKAGFETAAKHGIRLASDPDSDAPYFMTKILKEDYFDGINGVYTDPEGYFVADKNPEDFEKYDLTFPTKKKLKLPGQLV